MDNFLIIKDFIKKNGKKSIYVRDNTLRKLLKIIYILLMQVFYMYNKIALMVQP
ncbi:MULTISPECIES: hypothetical protein [unclassified Staphylococcus]|uniref:hypothetical protein n=1 Tax=unclassified Staphylococcus TaxID=91994 RepID=UPI0021D1F498|nr:MULTISPECIES: hypothetical protein [unclassified Staphylococcus]UXR69511.1 hypothetical protein MUA26_10405 [Staphylococcus sp. IVB6246]UXR71566.1 hypothetical protein MUA88_10410 [Staphylococcus sp. IVB6240]UXR73845.1 hypothetical protein MUA48_10920 [Staphylococcus sp. IVB6238]UXR76162.1 hypothetical protein MUA74_11015 [Staphylococcus sp. IVB6233]UXR80359.1 hypothetical protein MUA65_10620 [Staphylococcus sp. IVB6218]